MTKPLLTDSKRGGKLRKALDKLDFSKNEALARALNRIETLKHAVGKDIPLLTWISAPFRSLCMFRGIENTFIDMHRNPEDVKSLQLDLIDLWLAWGDACMGAGADIIWSSNPTASGLCISQSFYEEFVHPFCIKFYGAYRQKGYPIFFHPCGEWRDRFDLLCREGYHVLHLDNVDLADFKRTWGQEVGIWGNIKTVDTFLIGNPDKVREEAVECMLKEERPSNSSSTSTSQILIPLSSSNSIRLEMGASLNYVFQRLELTRQKFQSKGICYSNL
jgi:uroporphyrinogen-III decarboxylase